MARGAVVLVALFAGCDTSGLDVGFGVALTLRFDESVDDARLAEVTRILVVAQGDEQGAYTLALTRPANREERLVYRPGTASRSITLSAQALSSEARVVALGTADPLALAPGATAQATIVLAALSSDMAGQDLAGADLSGPAQVISFVAAPSVHTSGTPTAAASADFDGDGHPDVAVVCKDVGQVQVFLATADGRLSPTPKATIDLPGASAVITGSLSGSGVADLIVTSSADGKVHAFRNDGHGAFTADQSAFVLEGASSIVSADFDHDGKADVAVGSTTSSNMTIAYGEGSLLTVPMSHPIDRLVVADLDRDGYPDLVAVQALDGIVASVLNAQPIQPRTFGATFARFITGAVDVAIADLDGDGKLDEVVLTGTNMSATLLGAGDGTFGAPAMAGLGLGGGARVVLADLDGDGRPELISTHAPTGAAYDTLRVAPGRAGAQFGGARYYALGVAPGPILIADTDQDGKPDLVVGATKSNTLGVVRNLGALRFYAAGMAMGPDFLQRPDRPRLVDENGDGKLDLLLPDHGRVHRLAGDGNGGFSLLPPVFSASPGSAALGPLRPGSGDLVLGGTTGSLSVALAKPGGFGTAVETPVGATLSDVAIVDLDGDGRRDVVVADAAGDALFVFYGDDSGAIASAAKVAYPVPGGCATFAAVDVNGDGKLDLVAVSPAGRFDVLLGAAGGRLSAGLPYPTVGNPRSLVVLDADADGKLDVVIAGDGLQLHRGDGAGGFAAVAPAIVAPGSRLESIALADVNRDRAPDLLGVSAGGMQVFRRVAGTFIPDALFASGPGAHVVAADLDGDGLPDAIVTGGSNAAVLRNDSR